MCVYECVLVRACVCVCLYEGVWVVVAQVSES